MKNCFCGMVDWWKAFLALFPAGTIAKDSHHRESPVFIEWSCAVVSTTTRLATNHYTSPAFPLWRIHISVFSEKGELTNYEKVGYW